jgi:hypothetical protein
MHHSERQSDMAEEMKKALGLGPTGDFPEGQLNPVDEGGLKLAVGVEDGKVVIHFGKPVAWVGFSAQQARELAETIRKHSYKAEGR